MWTNTWRHNTWNALEQEWDLIIIGGGITGAGLLHEATRAGLQAVLFEAHDFAWGTSSRSSKLVHGGLRYLASGQIRLTRDSVHEREQLMQSAPGLVEPLAFLLADDPKRWSDNLLYRAGLMAYDLLALRWQHRRVSAEEMAWCMPHVAATGGMLYHDAQTDDARLVLRVLREACHAGGTALNYVRISELLRSQGNVCGVQVRDEINGNTTNVRAKIVINATGAWADRLRQDLDAAQRIRPLRGSHLVFAAWRLPIEQALTIRHPDDARPIFILPWEGATIIGTTDLDHREDLEHEPRISPEETSYLMRAVTAIFPTLDLSLADVISTWSGVRPVINSGASDPSKESRDHVVWLEGGLLTVTGGKLTTFRLIAQDALRQLKPYFPGLEIQRNAPTFMPSTQAYDERVSREQWRRLQGRYGYEASDVLAIAKQGERANIPGTQTLWCELRWAARNEGVQKLDDLLLRRVRLGNTLSNGAAEILPRLETICREEWGWSAAEWQRAVEAYQHVIKTAYSLPEHVPAWETTPTAAKQRHTLRNVVGLGLAALGVWGGVKWARR